MLASWIVGVPVRILTFTGQVWVTKHGIMRSLLIFLDRLSNALATTVLVDGNSQRQFLLSKNIISDSNSYVFRKNSLSGVDPDQFKIDPIYRKKIRHDLKVHNSTIVFIFVGRLCKEKGVIELVKAFSRLNQRFQNTALWFLGPDEEQLQKDLEQFVGVYLIPFSKVPEQYMAAADILCLPSYREGFGSVVIEAAACGIPSIGTKIYGLSDAIVDGETGMLVPARSVSELQAAMQLLIEDKTLRQKMGRAAQARALDKFSQSYLTEQLMLFYKMLLEKVYNEC